MIIRVSAREILVCRPGITARGLHETSVNRRWMCGATLGIALLGFGAAMPALAQVPSQEPFGGPSGAPPAAGTESRAAPPGGRPHSPPLARPRWRSGSANWRPRSAGSPTSSTRSRPVRAVVASGGTGGGGTGTGGADVGTPATAATPSASGGPAAPGQSLPPNPPPRRDSTSPATLESHQGNVKFGPGFEIRSNDDEFIFQFHNLTQFDYRGYQQGGQNPVHDTFDFPRQWFMFSGRITQADRLLRLAGQRLRHDLDCSTCFLDFDYDPRLQFRVGRFKTPFTYEFFVEPIQGLIIPERSVFFNNFGQNRDLGVMAFGRLFDNTLDYAVGIFNGTRNGSRRPQRRQGRLRRSSTGSRSATRRTRCSRTSTSAARSSPAHQHNVPVPQTLRTVVPTAGNAVARRPVPRASTTTSASRATGRSGTSTPPGSTSQLAVIGEWGSGFQDYALDEQPPGDRTHLPVQSFYVQAGYLLTGETRSSVGIVKPLRPFDLRKGQFGLGAWELTGRYDYLDIGNEVFTNGLADPNLWANRRLHDRRRASTGTSPSTSRSTSTGSTPTSAARSCSPPGAVRRPATCSCSGSSSTSESPGPASRPRAWPCRHEVPERTSARRVS